MRAPETDAVPVAATDVACGPELELLSALALLFPPVHAATTISGRIVAHPCKTRLIFSPVFDGLLWNQIILCCNYLPSAIAPLPGIRELESPVKRTLLSLPPEVQHTRDDLHIAEIVDRHSFIARPVDTIGA
jgi:hypothetical protein